MSTAVSRTGFAPRGAGGDPLAIARRYAARRANWPQVRFDRRRRWYQRLAVGPEAEVWLLSWLPGQGTDLHDHGGAAGAFLVVAGTLTEHTPTGGNRDGDVFGSAGPRRRDDGGWRLRQSRWGEGQGRVFGARHIHRIRNAGGEPAVSVHVYRPALQEMTRYEITDDRLVVTAVDSAGVDW
ncbi:cysteine dioxygenase family protein [Micromonospora sp. C95]|uniref:cysteine dioxygenase n=1 Tax=Micromonospora sp. C95 TaxID=2824882 RepID=UPI001B38668B|nr:cysteine dioxygenase family protein [Micromonospora sp. C95]MBQ1022749.1 cysteine dioxygenase family protein [Micromonospora sp. C95]